MKAEFSVAPLAFNTGIYEIVNTTTGSRYVGSAVNLTCRWRQHRCELGKGRHNPHMQRAWAKYGEAAFVFQVIEFVPDKALLLEREQHYINTLRPEYNCARIAGSNFGMTARQETRDRISRANRRTWAEPGYREKMSLAHAGQVFTEEHREKIGAAHRGKKLSPAHSELLARINAERNRSTEHRALMSAYWRGRPKTAEQIEKAAAAKRGAPLSSEHRDRLAEAMRLAHAEGRHDYERSDALRHQIGRALATLNDAHVLEILDKRRHGAKQSVLSAEYGISQAAVSNICNRKTYTWLKTED